MADAERSLSSILVWHWRRAAPWIYLANVLGVAMIVTNGLESRFDPGPLTVLATVLVAVAVGSRDPARLTLAHRLVGSWRRHFRAGRLLLMAACSPALLAGTVAAWRAGVSGPEVLRIAVLAVLVSWLVHDWAVAPGGRERVLTPGLLILLLIGHDGVPREGAWRWLFTAFALAAAHLFTKAQAAGYWRRSEIMVEEETARAAFGARPLRASGSVALWFLYFLLGLTLHALVPRLPDSMPAPEELWLIALSSTLVVVSAQSLYRLRFGEPAAERVFARIVRILLTVLVVVFGASLVMSFGAETGRAIKESPKTSAELRIFFIFAWFFVVLATWGWSEKVRSRRVEFWDRQLALMRRLPLGRLQIAGRLAQAVNPIVLRAVAVIFAASVVLLAWGQWHDPLVLKGTAQRTVLAALAVSASLYAAAASLALGLRDIHQLGVGFFVFVLLFMLQARMVSPVTAVVTVGTVLLASFAAVFFKAGPGGVADALIGARFRR